MSRADRDDALVIRNVTVRDENRRVVFRGDVESSARRSSVSRTARGCGSSHDGIVFENRERRLPAKPSGYYHEFVQPTPGDNGPGAQRVILGAGGEVLLHFRPLSNLPPHPLTMPNRAAPQFEFVSDLTGFRAPGGSSPDCPDDSAAEKTCFAR